MFFFQTPSNCSNWSIWQLGSYYTVATMVSPSILILLSSNISALVFAFPLSNYCFGSYRKDIETWKQKRVYRLTSRTLSVGHVFNWRNVSVLWQIDDLKLMKDHQTGRSAGYCFITVCLTASSVFLKSQRLCFRLMSAFRSIFAFSKTGSSENLCQFFHSKD